ncbi:kinase-like domain-containing protein [Xylogone sp. PMI_703]|nr:kinase-like domain-containing protein [Xylogone sp. PMI_703]
MASNPDKRLTQLSFNKLREYELHPHSGNDAKWADDHSDRTVARQNITKQQSRERASSSKTDAIDTSTGMARLRLVEAVNSGVRARGYVMTKEGSPWRNYKRIYQLRLGVGDHVTIAEHKSHPFDLVTMRCFSGPRVGEKLDMLQQIQHPNFVSAFEAFRFEQSLYIVFEHMPISLHYIAGNPYINKLRLASVLGQILGGLAYLGTKGLEHDSLTCSNILINPDGDVKITDQECCHTHPLGSVSRRDIRALSLITMELMQGYAKDDRVIGVDDLHRWPNGSDAVSFLSETTSASSVGELMKHPLMLLPWQKEKLKGLVSLASLWAHRDYKYTPS